MGFAMILSTIAMAFTLGVFFAYTRGRVSRLSLSPSGDWLFIHRINLFAFRTKEHLAMKDVQTLPNFYGKMEVSSLFSFDDKRRWRKKVRNVGETIKSDP